MWLATELETLAKQYFYALQLGHAVILSDEAIAETQAKILCTHYPTTALP